MTQLNESNSGTTLATVTAGIVIAILFLIISSYVSNDASWNIKSDRAWVTTTLTVDDMAGTIQVLPLKTDVNITVKKDSQNNGENHSYDALYREDFMNTSAAPT